MVSEEYLAIVKRLRPKDRHGLTSLRSFSTWFRRHGLTAAAYESFPKVAPESMRPADPLDVRCMPRVLLAFQRDAGVSEGMAKEYARHVKKLFMQDGVAIEDMVSIEYLAIVKRLRPFITLVVINILITST